MKKKVAAVVIMAIVGIVGLYAVGDTGVKHTIKTKQGEIEKSISLRIKSEGVRRVVSITKEKEEKIKIGFRTEAGELYVKQGNSWKEDKSIETYYNYVKGLNSYVETAGEITEIEDVGYYEGEIKSRGLFKGKEEAAEIELRDEEGIHIIVIEKEGTAKVISFRDKYRIGETTEEEIKGWIEWLKSSSKGENEKYRRISQRVYLSLTSKTPYKGLYEEEGKYLREYLGIIYGNNNKYKEIKEEEIEKAKRYVAAKITYTKENPKFKEIMEEIKSILEDKERNRREKLIALGKLGGINNEELIEAILDIKKTWKESILEICEIVPKIEEVKAGDIVIFKEEGKEERGIVVQTDGTGKYETINVIYMDKKDKVAVEKNLGEIKEKADNKEVVIIRLIEGEKKDITNEVWNVMNDKIKDVKIEIGTMKESTQKSDEKHRWIPNTGEYLELGNIKVTIKTEIGIEKIKENVNVSFIGAEDRGYKKESGTEEGNIYKNKGEKFEVKINVGEEKTYTLEKTEGKYNLYENKSETEKTETEETFTLNGQGYLVDAKTKQKVKIKIRPEKDQINPGDDLLLKFKVRAKVGTEENPEYTVEAKDYIAVYDKKMLWRANQYINETEAKLQNVDWNNAHPWDTDDKNIEWYETNDWQEESNGGQIPIKGWTRFNDNRPVYNSVAYGWGCIDCVKEFNEELENQLVEIKQYRTKKETEKEKKYAELSWGESETTAPEGKWENYIFDEEDKVLEVEDKKLKDKKKEELYLSKNKPSVPGLSTYWYSLDMITGKYYKYEQAVRTSGIDCSGLAYVSTRYEGSKYETNQFNNVDKPGAKHFKENTSAWISGKTVTIRPLSYKIFKGTWDLNPTINSNTRPSIIENRDNQRKLLSYAVPGDILVTDSHVVIIQDLNYEGDNTVITDYSQVYVIHATQGGKSSPEQWNVQKGNWNELGETKKLSYQLRRLEKEKINE